MSLIVCSICQDGLADEPSDFPLGQECVAVALKCGHLYHKLCLERWMAHKTECPCCKRHVQLDDVLRIYPTCNDDGMPLVKGTRSSRGRGGSRSKRWFGKGNGTEGQSPSGQGQGQGQGQARKDGFIPFWKLKRDYDQAIEKLQAKTESYNGVKKILAEYERKLTNINSAQMNLNRRHNELLRNYDALRRNNQELEKKLQAQKRMSDVFERSNYNFKQKYEDVLGKCKILMEENQSLKTSNTKLLTLLDVSDKLNQKLKVEIQALSTQLESCKEAANLLELDHGNLLEKHAEQEEKLKELEKKNLSVSYLEALLEKMEGNKEARKNISFDGRTVLFRNEVLLEVGEEAVDDSSSNDVIQSNSHVEECNVRGGDVKSVAAKCMEMSNGGRYVYLSKSEYQKNLFRAVYNDRVDWNGVKKNLLFCKSGTLRGIMEGVKILDMALEMYSPGPHWNMMLCYSG